MSKKEKIQKNNKPKDKDKKKESILHYSTKKWIKAVLMFLIAIIAGLSFIDKGGVAGQFFVRILKVLFGDSKITVATIILSLLFSGFIFLKSKKKIRVLAITFAILSLVIGISGISANQNLNKNQVGLIGFLAQILV